MKNKRNNFDDNEPLLEYIRYESLDEDENDLDESAEDEISDDGDDGHRDLVKSETQKIKSAHQARAKKPVYKKVWFWVLAVFLTLILAAIVTVIVLIQVGKSSLLDTGSMNLNPGDAVSNVVVEDNGMTVTYNNKKYVYNENITTVLCMGVDKESLSDTDVIGKNGQADALFLYAMDTETGKSTIIPIPRDTMTSIDLYSNSGAYVSQEKKQICLAYAYGDGKEKSCENTIKSVSRLFYGLQINSYVTIDLKAVEVLTEKLGGVTVTSNETFSFDGYSFYKGKKTNIKKGKQARVFIQDRGDELDASLKRMERQQQFLTAFFNKVLAKTKEDITFPVDVYKSSSKYMLTDINVAEISFLASCVVSGEGGMEFKSFDGEMKLGEKHAEFYADEQSVYDVIIDVFYKQVG